MPYIFLVDARNFTFCIENQLLGVPVSRRALSQIMNVQNGDQLFIYVYKEKLLYGVFTAKGDVFQEQHPERGPWTGRGWDEAKGFYPYRIQMLTSHDFRVPLSLDDMERLGIRENRLKGMSVVYITEDEANQIKNQLARANAPVRKTPTPEARAPFQSTPNDIRFSNLVGDEEARLQPVIQTNIAQLEDDLKVVGTYVNLREQLGYRGEVDILARSPRDYVVIEVKAGAPPETIWNQVFSYTSIIRGTYHTETRAIVVCGGLDRKTLFAYPDLRRRLANQMDLRLFEYSDLDAHRGSIRFQEIPWK